MASNLDLLKQIEDVGLKAFDLYLKIDAAQDQQEINSYIKPVASGLDALNANWDPALVADVQDSLNVLKEQSSNKDYNKSYRSGLANAYKYSQIALDNMSMRHNMLEQEKEKMAGIYDDASVLQGGRSVDFHDVVNDLGYNKTQMIAKAANNNLDRVKSELDNLGTEGKAINLMRKIDADKTLDGLQIKLDEESTAYYKQIAEELGLGQYKDVEGAPETPEGYLNYYLPEDMRVNIDTYADAAAWLDKWEAQNVTNQITSLDKQIKHEETRVFDFVTQLGLSNDPLKRAGFQAIVTSLYGTDKVKDATAKVFQDIDMIDPSFGKEIRAYLNELNTTFATGEYEGDFNDLKTLSIGMADASSELSEDQITEAMTEASNKAVANIKVANDRITALGKDYVSDIAGNVEALDKTPGRADVLKRQVSQSMQGLVDKQWFWYPGDLAGSDADHPLMKFRDAASTDEKYKHLKKLTETYLDSNGNRLKPDEISEIFDDAKETEVFVSLLQAFQSLMVLSPVKTLDARDINTGKYKVQSAN